MCVCVYALWYAWFKRSFEKLLLCYSCTQRAHHTFFFILIADLFVMCFFNVLYTLYCKLTRSRTNDWCVITLRVKYACSCVFVTSKLFQRFYYKCLFNIPLNAFTFPIRTFPLQCYRINRLSVYGKNVDHRTIFREKR